MATKKVDAKKTDKKVSKKLKVFKSQNFRVKKSP